MIRECLGILKPKDTSRGAPQRRGPLGHRHPKGPTSPCEAERGEEFQSRAVCNRKVTDCACPLIREQRLYQAEGGKASGPKTRDLRRFGGRQAAKQRGANCLTERPGPEPKGNGTIGVGPGSPKCLRSRS